LPDAPLEVTQVVTRSDLRHFVDLPYRLHRHDRLWAPALRRDVSAQLDRRRNPFYEHAEMAEFLARRRNEVVGRIAAIDDRRHNEFHGEQVGFFGFFECTDDPAAAAGLLDAAASWLAGRGLVAIRGPISPSTNDEAGLLVDGLDTPSTLLMPHNPEYYARLVEGAGFRKAKDLFAFQSTGTELPERLIRASDVVERRFRVRVRSVNLRRFDEELQRVKALYNAAWERNWGFVPLTDREVDAIAARLRPIVVPDLALLAEHEGTPIGLGIALPDLNVALRSNPSGRIFPGLIRVLWAARRITRLRIFMLGVVPDWRVRGVDALLYRRIWEQGYARGFRWAEAGWVLEDNLPMTNALTRMGFEVYKTYRIYERPL
jgi:GNAT superfamily N-acetyltransferase